jgi:hypothetical protein
VVKLALHLLQGVAHGEFEVEQNAKRAAQRLLGLARDAGATREQPPTIASVPTRTNWWMPTNPPIIAWSSTRICPASAALLAMMTWSPTRQSCATWAYAMKRQSEPMTVLLPPPAVPGLIVTYSRIWFRSPMISTLSSPAYFKSWGMLPITAPVKSWQSEPIVVRPSITQ